MSSSFSVLSTCIEQVSSAKSLGVYIDQTLLNLECHINSVCKNIASAIGAIKRMRHLSYVMFWSSFIIALSNLTLIIVLWCGETVTRALISEKLQRLQNRAASVLMSTATYDSNLEDVFRTLGWHKLCHQKLEKKSIMMFKTVQGMTPEYLRSRFVYRGNASSYCLRNTENKLVLLQPSTDYLKSRFSYSGTRNNLPTKIRTSNLLKDFKVKKVATVLSKVSVKLSVWLFRHGFMKSSFYFF